MSGRKRLPPEVRRALAKVRDRTATEADLQRVVIRYAKDHGWLVDHTLPARFRDGRWATAVQGHPGRPDVLLIRERLVLAELKTEQGALSAGQEVWFNRARDAGVEIYLWRPRHWDDIKDVLRAANAR